MKVAQFGAKVAEKTDYHHGEASLMGAIIGMAQNYMGSNNINLLEPIGAFGSRLSNGKDAASPRYIFTSLSKIAKCVFDSRDAPLLNYLNNDGMLIEPEWFAPVIPMILVNGALGIGSGFSTTVLKYDVEQICQYLLQKMRGEKPVKNLKPWYRGFNGTIEKVQPGKYISHGVYEFDDTKRAIVITELPIGTPIDDYKETIEEMLADKNNQYVSDIRYGNSDVIIHMEIIISSKKYAEVRELDSDAIRNMFKLSSKLSSTNMFLFNHEGIMSKYNNIYEIINEFYKVRLDMYHTRRTAIIDQLKYELMILANKVRFIKDVKTNKVKLATISDTSLLAFLVDNDYDQDRGINGEPLEEPTLKEFAYMIDMSIRTITLENAKKLQNKHDEKQAELDLILKTSATDMWESDINDVIRANKEQNDSLIAANSMDKPKVAPKRKATKARDTKK
jgi:DNA topoisomerase II